MNSSIDEQTFSIRILSQNWLEGCSPREDLCSHGTIKLIIGDHLISSGELQYGIIESALALLRSVYSDHNAVAPVAQRLIFHGCSLMMMITCPIGIDWSVLHRGELITIDDVVRYDSVNEEERLTFPEVRVNIPSDHYKRQVTAFARNAKHLYDSVEKSFYDDFECRMYNDFWEEYNRLLEQ